MQTTKRPPPLPLPCSPGRVKTMAVQCGHCGRNDTLESIDHVTLFSKPTKVWFDREGSEDAEYKTIVWVQRCIYCTGPTFSTYGWVDGWSDPGDLDGLKLLYPSPRRLDDLPERVQFRYGKMLDILHEPDAFAVRAGRLLEAVCSDQGVSAGNLGPRLDRLVSQGPLPAPLAAQAHLVREYRNIGGHDDDLEVGEEDVPLVRQFVEALLEFLYWGPAKLAAGAALLEARRNALNQRPS